MTTEEKMRELKKIEEYRYIFPFLYAIKVDYLGWIKEPQKPFKPTAPLGTVQPYPPYDEDLYIRKTKEREYSKYSSFRERCVVTALGLASTLIGLLICWIPLVVAFFSLPFQVGERRKIAYRIYTDECEEIKRRNQKLIADKRRYEEDLKVYTMSMEKYEAAMVEYDCKKRLLQEKRKRLSSKLQSIRFADGKLESTLWKIYASLKLPSNCKNYVSVYMIHSYLEEGSCTTLDECVARHNKEEADGMFVPDISLVLKHRNVFQKKCPKLIRACLECEGSAQDMVEELEHYMNENWNSDCISCPLPLTDGLLSEIQAIVARGGKL